VLSIREEMVSQPLPKCFLNLGRHQTNFESDTAFDLIDLQATGDGAAALILPQPAGKVS